MIAVDDLRPELGCYGRGQMVTPHIDGLAAGGTVFRRAYCQQAVCNPSRASLMTGCRPDTTRVYNLRSHFRDALPDVVTLGQHFKAHGYHSESFGKIYHRGQDDAPTWSVPFEPIRAREFRLPENRDCFTFGVDDDDIPRNQRRYGPIVEAADRPDDEYRDGHVAQAGLAALERHRDQPFFLAVGFRKPHIPFVAPKRYWDLYDRDDIDLADNPFAPEGTPPYALNNWNGLRRYTPVPRHGPVPDDLAREMIHGYYACVSFIDAQVGRLLAKLEELGLAEDTVVCLWGDHGFHLGDHGLWTKHSNFENACRSPLIVRAPGQAAAGAATEALVEFVDIYPTLSELAGLPQPGHLEGDSFASLLNEPDRPWKSAAFSQYPRSNEQREPLMGYSIKTDRYRYTEWQYRDRPGCDAVELYDHEQDPNETVNAASEPSQVDICARLSRVLNAGWRAARPKGA